MKILGLCTHKNGNIKSVYILKDDITTNKLKYFIRNITDYDQVYNYESMFIYANKNCILITDQTYPISQGKLCINELNLNSSLVLVYNKYEKKDMFLEIDGKLDSIKGTLMENIDIAIQNTVSLEKLAERSDELAKSSYKFKKSSHALKNKLWWDGFKIKLLIALTILAIIGIIIGVSFAVTKNN